MSKNKNEKPSNYEVSKLRKFLVSAGISNSEAAQLVKATRSRKENADAILERIK